MNTRSSLLPLAVVLGAVAAAPAQDAATAADTDAWRQHRTTRVLYAGWPDGSREKAFREFLGEWFDEVRVIGLGELSVASAASADVVIADWCSQYGNDGYPQRDGGLHSVPVQLGVEFSKPVIALDYVSSQLRRRHKLDWL